MQSVSGIMEYQIIAGNDPRMFIICIAIQNLQHITEWFIFWKV